MLLRIKNLHTVLCVATGQDAMMASQQAARALGEWGERAAREFLAREGYSIHETNWHCARGELDIIAERDGILVFVEVKTRRGGGSDAWNAALESITPRKRERLLAAIYHYLDDVGLEENEWRLDVIAVLWHEGAPPRLKHVEGALGW